MERLEERKKRGDGDVSRCDRDEVMVALLKLPGKSIQGIGMKAITILPENLFVNLLIKPRFDERQMWSTGLERSLVCIDKKNLTEFKSEPVTQNNGR